VEYGRIVLELPDWVEAFVADWSKGFASTEAQMRFALELAQRNMSSQTGGPFGAAVFEAATNTLTAVGVNLVEPARCSLAHAEMMALALAQQTVGHYDLGRTDAIYELVTSTEPCAMCLGAIPWSGVRRVVCGARGEDACAIGFDEGAKPADWVGELENRGITVVRDILRDEARVVLTRYAESGGIVYNARDGMATDS
jgi:tRNA(Arg) A34 adenosine deaminase TadA